MTNISDLWQPITAGAVVAGAVGGFGYFMDNKVSEEVRSKVRATLSGVGAETFPTLFVRIFDRLFDPRRQGRPRFWRSFAASFIILMALVAMWAVLLPERFDEVTFQIWWESLLMGIVAIVINGFGDYLSLIESRHVIGKISVSRSSGLNAGWLALDLVLTVLIFLVMLAISVLIILFVLGLDYSMLSGIFPGFWPNFLEILANTKEILLFTSGIADRDILALFCYTTLFTSVWLWVFWWGGVLSRVFVRLRKLLSMDKWPIGTPMAIGALFLGAFVTAGGYVRLALLSP